MMNFNILLTGVGGQGTVLASKLLAQTAIAKGYEARTSETIGMAQRGGCVTSHVRIGEGEISPLIPAGGADLILAFEPAEALRNLHYLKPGAPLVVNTRAVIPITCAMGSGYNPGEIIEALEHCGHPVVLVDGGALCERLGSYKALNTVLLGVALSEGLLPFTAEDMAGTIRANLPEKFHKLNLEALRLSRKDG